MRVADYIVALTNLYGLVHKEKVLEIYNQQNEEKVSIETIEAYLETGIPWEFVYTHGNYFVHEAIYALDSFEEELALRRGKPYYVPEKKELLRYTDPLYFEKTKEHYTLLAYIKKNFFPDDPAEAEDFAREVVTISHIGFSASELSDLFDFYEIVFSDLDQANECLRLITNVANTTRLWENNGHTPREIVEKYERQHLRPLPTERPQAMGEGRRIGRNDPCPCGSGEKYKRCCGC